MQTFMPPPDVELTVYGRPATAGNKTAFPFQRKGGGLGVRVREGKKDGPPQVWRGRVIEAVQAQVDAGAPMLDGPLEAWVVFYLPKPASAPKRRRTWPDRKPDLSKLLRAIEDPMTGVLIADDARIVRFCRLEKLFADDDEVDQRPRAEVKLWRVDESAVPMREGVNQTTQEALALEPVGTSSGEPTNRYDEEALGKSDQGQGLRSEAGAVARRAAIALGVVGWFAICIGVKPGWWL